VFPLLVSPDGRRLITSEGTPFLLQADTPWMMFLRRSVAEAHEYLSTRNLQGFTTMQVQLTGFLGMTDRNGHYPFGPENDFTKPDDLFFAHVDQVIDVAEAMGILMAIAPAWSGCCGEGWAGKLEDGSPRPINAHGPDGCRALGEWLGARFAHRSNIMWILGGDQDPYDAFEEIRALAGGLKAAAPHHLCTYHPSSSHSSTDVYPHESWLDVNMTYTYFRGFPKCWNRAEADVHEENLRQARKLPRKPIYLGESTYEGEHDEMGSALQARKQAYGSMLSGGMGHAYGSRYWRMEDDFRDALALPGARSMVHLAELFTEVGWADLRPAFCWEVLCSDEGWGLNDFAPTSYLKSRSIALAYVPSERVIQPAQGWQPMEWFDPTSGRRTPFRVGVWPGTNEDGDPDWVLILRGEPTEAR
jgi:hypothetical protein